MTESAANSRSDSASEKGGSASNGSSVELRQASPSTPSWPAWKCIVWLLLAAGSLWLWGVIFVNAVRPTVSGKGVTPIYDFFQEWASARNWYAGDPIYTPHTQSIQKHLGMKRSNDGSFWIERNAHPPTSVLFALPFGWLDYLDGFFAWNLLSLAAFAYSLRVVTRELSVPYCGWTFVAMVTILLWCNPFTHQVVQGQLNMFLMLPITLGWAAWRRNELGKAGVWLGAAAAFKLFPAYLFLVFLARREWKGIFSGGLTFVGLTALTAAVLSPATYESYYREVLPAVMVFRDWWLNVSCWGYWHKLFDAPSGHVIPIMHAPLIAKLGSLGSAMVFTLIAGWTCFRAKTSPDRDLAFAVTSLAMLLSSPITWDHYYLVLVPALAAIWMNLPRGSVARAAFVTLFFVMCASPNFVWRRFMKGPGEFQGQVMTTGQVLTIGAYGFYALLAMFLIAVWLARHSMIVGACRIADAR